MTRSFLHLTVFAWHGAFAGCKSLKPHCMPVECSLKVERLKTKTTDAKQHLSDLKDRQRHKRELERIRKEHERETKKAATNEAKSTQDRVALLDATGKWIGSIETQTNGNVDVYDAKGRIVARELTGVTLDHTGRFVGRGRQELVVLGAKCGGKPSGMAKN